MIFNNKIKKEIFVAIIAFGGFFICFHPFSASASTNLVPNPSLETASTTQISLPYGWRKGGYGINTRILTYPVSGYASDKAVKTEITNYTSGDAKWYFYSVPVVAGEQYEFSDYYISNTENIVTLQLQMNDGTYKYLDIAILPTADEWQNFRKIFTVPANVVGLSVFHLIKSTGYIMVDNYSLVQIDAVPPSINIIEPVHNQTVSGSLNVLASASDNNAVSGVKFFIGDLQLGAESIESPYSVFWDTLTYADGLRTITATARDDSGNTATSSAVVVNVQNKSSFSGSSSSSSSSISSSSSSDQSSSSSSSSSASTNLVPNPSLETASTTQISLPYGWRKGGYGINTRILTYPVSGYASDKAVKTEITNYTSGDAKWYFYSVPVVAGEQYEFSDYYTANIPSFVTAQITMSDGTVRYADIANAEPSETWHNIYGTFVAPEGAVSVTIFHLIKTVGHIIVDDYLFKKVISDPDNLIYNGSLENQNYNGSKPDGWNTNSYGSNQTVFSYKTGYGLNGSKATRVDATNYVFGDAKWYPKEINVSGGEEYLFSDYYVSSAPSNTTIQFRMSNGTYSYLGLMNYIPSSKWKKTESSFIVPEGAVAMIPYHSITGNGYLTTDNYLLKKLPSGKFSEGMVTLNFDDGFYSVYQNALPILDAAGIKSSQYIVSNFLNNSFYVNPEETINMFSEGHEIGSHTVNHIRLTPLSDTDMRNEIFDSKENIESIGVGEVKTFVYPFGDFNDAVRQAVIDAGYIGARTVFSGYNTKNSDKFSLKDQHIESNVSIEQIKSYINRALADKTWLIFELHATDYSGNQYSNTPETLQAIVDYLVQKQVKVVTTEEGIELMSQ